jgi:TonB family protein
VTPKRAVSAHAPRLSPASEPSATSPAAGGSHALATVAPTLSSDTASVLALAAPPATVRRFALSAGSVASHASRPGLVMAAATTRTTRHETTGDSGALAEEQVDRPAQVLVRATAVYPEAARLAEIETDVPLVLTVGSDGHVISAAALAHPGYGLEEAAVRAAQAYLFRPAERSGHAVAVQMRWVIQFRLR